MVRLSSKNGLSEEAHEVVRHYDKVEGRFRGEELVHVEAVHAEVILELLYPVLCVGPFPLEVSHRFCRKCEVCHEETVSVVPVKLLLPEQLKLFAGRPGP